MRNERMAYDLLMKFADDLAKASAHFAEMTDVARIPKREQQAMLVAVVADLFLHLCKSFCRVSPYEVLRQYEGHKSGFADVALGSKKPAKPST